MDFQEYPISQSIIRELLHNGEEREVCPRRLYLTKITRKVKDDPSMPMLYGKYFETHCLGKSAKGDKQLDLPRKKLTKKQLAENEVRKKEKRPIILGDKYLDHIRTDDQIRRFKALAKENQMIITSDNVQVSAYALWEKDPLVLLKGEFDIFPTPILIDGELQAAIIDLKLTADLHATYGEYCYGSPEYLDLIQAKMYHYIVRNLDRTLNKGIDEIVTDSVKNLISKNRILFLLWIFNYKGQILEDKFIRVNWDKTKESELHESIRKTIMILTDMENREWPTNPTYQLCKRCAWKGCPDKIKIQTV